MTRCSPILVTALLIGGCTVARDVPAPTATTPVLPTPIGEGVGDGGAAALRRASPAPSTVLVEPWTNGKKSGERIMTDHYSLRTTLRNGDLRRFLPTFVETALAHYTSALGNLPQPSAKLETYIFGSRDEWETFTRERLGSEAGAYMGLGRGGYTSRACAILYDIGPNDTLTILAHEGWHQYTQSVFREELPVWLEEGIATYMEGYRIAPDSGDPIFGAWRNLERFGELRDAVRRDRLIPLQELLERSPQEFLAQGREQLLIYYAEVWALVHFLNSSADEIHRNGLRRLLSDATEGRIGATILAGCASPDARRSVERALSRGGVRALPGPTVAATYFGGDLAALSDRFDAFIKEITVRGAGEAIWRGTSPIKPAPAAAP